MAQRIRPSCSAFDFNRFAAVPFSSAPPAFVLSFPAASTLTIRHALAESSSP